MRGVKQTICAFMHLPQLTAWLSQLWAKKALRWQSSKNFVFPPLSQRLKSNVAKSKVHGLHWMPDTERCSWLVCLYGAVNSDLDNFIDPRKSNSFAASPVLTCNSIHKNQKLTSHMSETTDQYTLVKKRKTSINNKNILL